MMASQISAIYTAFENMTITVSSVTPRVYGLTGLPNSIAAADLPARVLLDLANAAEGQSMEFFTVNSGIGGGGAQYVDWQMNDLLLWMPEAHGRGVKDVATALIAYCGKYIDTVRNSRNIVSSASFTGLRVSPGVYEYPAGSGQMYWGVMATSTIREIIE